MPTRTSWHPHALPILLAFLLSFSLLAEVAVAHGSDGTRPLPPAEYLLEPEDYLEHGPNELGRIPIFMYHNIVPNDFDTSRHDVGAYMFRTYDQFWNDMLWLYEHDFHLIGMKDLLSGDIDIPAGKHPVVFTFDDGSSLHFSATKAADGSLVIDEHSAVGLMEKFYEQYPGFGRGAHFAIVPAHKFSWPDHEQDDLFDLKLEWLMANGYEVGNHTLTHPNLNSIDLEEFVWTVGEPIVWGDEAMGADTPGNCMRVLTLPFGIYPNAENYPVKNDMLRNGFLYENQVFTLDALLHLNGGSSPSLWTNEYDQYLLPRVPVEDAVLDAMKDSHLNGHIEYYTSDGIEDAVTVPWPPPQSHIGQLNPEAIEAAGKQFVRYHPETGKVYPHRDFTQHIWIRGA